MDIHFSCSNCGQSIVIDEAGAGMEFPCPACQTSLTVPQPQREEVVLLTQICPGCERAWPAHERVCDHCGTALGEAPAEEPVEAAVVAEPVSTGRLKLSDLLGIAPSASPRPAVASAGPAVKPASSPPAPPRPALGRPGISPPPVPLPGAPRSTVPSAVPAPPAAPRPSRLARPDAAASAPPMTAVAAPTGIGPAGNVPPPDMTKDQYECNNDACGSVWYENQLRKQVVGRKTLQVCPKCGLGVRKILKPVNFWASLPGAFAYPFRGTGGWILGLGTPLYAVLDYGRMTCFGIISLIMLLGIFGLLLTNVIRCTVDDDTEPLDWPEFEGFGQVALMALQIVVVIVLVLGPAFILAIMAGVSMLTSGAQDGGLFAAGAAGLAAVCILVLGAAYLPMALLGLAMFDSIKGANPLLIVPAMFKVPVQYLVVLILLGAMVFLRNLAQMLTVGIEFPYNLLVIAVVEFFVLYTLIVSARLLGLLYRANAEKIGWFT